MIFTISIKNSLDNIILHDLFHMDSISEMINNFNALKNENISKSKPLTGNYYNLCIDSNDISIINVFIPSLFLLQTIKDNIYEEIIKKSKEYDKQDVLYPVKSFPNSKYFV